MIYRLRVEEKGVWFADDDDDSGDGFFIPWEMLRKDHPIVICQCEDCEKRRDRRRKLKQPSYYRQKRMEGVEEGKRSLKAKGLV